MKVSSFKNLKLSSSCPVCDSIDHFKLYLNGGECRSKNHAGKQIFFIYPPGKDTVQKIEIIEHQYCIEFDLMINKIKVMFPESDDDIELPLFDMNINNISIKAIKEMLVFV